MITRFPENQNVNAAFRDSASIDAFGRLRTSQVQTLFDSKQLYDNSPLFWDDAETSGSGTSSAHSANEAATTISVGATTAGTRVRQTKQRWNYQPGKGQLIYATFSEFDTSTGITKRVGYFDDNNGLFFESDEGALKVVRRTYVSGSAVDNTVAQSSWNIDPLDGTGSSGITLDLTKTQIAYIEFEWLGVGRAVMGFVIDGAFYRCHQFLNTNSLTTVYMSTPNLPVRYEIANDGNGAADDFVHICSMVASEGGVEDTGVLFSKDTGSTHIDLAADGTTYPVIGLRLKSTHLGVTVKLLAVSILEETGTACRWSLQLNPTLSAGLTYSDIANAGTQGALGNGTITVSSPGTVLSSGYISDADKAGSAAASELANALSLGATIAGTRDELVLCITPLGTNIDIQASLNWRELL